LATGSDGSDRWDDATGSNFYDCRGETVATFEAAMRAEPRGSAGQMFGANQQTLRGGQTTNQ
jgi:hypothetical protein